MIKQIYVEELRDGHPLSQRILWESKNIEHANSILEKLISR